MVGVRREAGVEHALDLRVALEEAGDPQRAGVLALDAEREGLEPAVQQVGAVAVEHPAEHPAEVPDRADQPGVAGHGPGQQVVVAAEVLGAGVQSTRSAPLPAAAAG